MKIASTNTVSATISVSRSNIYSKTPFISLQDFAVED